MSHPMIAFSSLFLMWNIFTEAPGFLLIQIPSLPLQNAGRMSLDLAVSPRAVPGCEQCYDVALMDRYPPDNYCEDTDHTAEGVVRHQTPSGPICTADPTYF